MTSRDHTPGPWRVQTSNFALSGDDDRVGIVATHGNATGLVVVAEVFSDCGPGWMKNAHLIACAPALLSFVELHAGNGNVLAQRLVIQAKGGAL